MKTAPHSRLRRALCCALAMLTLASAFLSLPPARISALEGEPGDASVQELETSYVSGSEVYEGEQYDIVLPEPAQEALMLEDESIPVPVEAPVFNDFASPLELVQPPECYYAQDGASSSSVGDAIVSALYNRMPSLNIERFNIPLSDINDIFVDTVYSNPQLFYVNPGASYMSDGSTVREITFSYNSSLSTDSCISAFRLAASRAVSTFSSGGMSELQRAIAIHDYLGQNVEYHTTALGCSTAYGALVGGRALCQGYAMAYAYLARLVGLECRIVKNTAKAHMWNLVQIDGSWYHIDATGDDPVPDSLGRVLHDRCVVSTRRMTSLGYTADSLPYSCNSVKYDDAWWKAVKTGMPSCGHTLLYALTDSSFKTTIGVWDPHADTRSTFTSISNNKWFLSGSTFSSEDWTRLTGWGNEFFYNTPTALVKFNPSGIISTTTIVSAQTSATNYNRVYGCRICPDGTLLYSLKGRPEVTDSSSMRSLSGYTHPNSLLTSFSLSGSASSITSSQASLTVTPSAYSPSNTFISAPIYYSSDPQSLVVSKDGVVTAVGGSGGDIICDIGGVIRSFPVSVSIPTASVTIAEGSSLSLKKNSSAVLHAQVSPWNCSDTPVWSSSDSTVVAVSGSTITAKKGGSAVLTVNCGGRQASITVNVNVLATMVTLSKSSATVARGSTLQLTASRSPSDCTEAVTYSSSDASVASVSSGGLVTALKVGTATITATCGRVTDICEITVNAPPEAVAITNKPTTLPLGSSLALTASVTPSDATGTRSWKSSNTAAVTVSSAGVIKAVGIGSAVITFTCGGVSDSCTVEVPAVPCTSLSFSSSGTVLDKGDSYTLNPTVKPEGCTDPLSYSVSGDAVTLSSGRITAVKAGTVTVTASCGDKRATFTITVKVPASSISLDKSELTLQKGESGVLTASALPADYSEGLSWKSSDTSVAVVSNGTVTAVGGGRAIITASAYYEKSAQCTVTVTAPCEGFTVPKLEGGISLRRGDSLTDIVCVPDNADCTDPVSFSISDRVMFTLTPHEGERAADLTCNYSGTALLTVTCGSITRQYTVTGTESVFVGTSELLKSTDSLTGFVGEAFACPFTALPANHSDIVRFASSDTAVAQVDEVTGLITLAGPGTATVTAQPDGSTLSASVSVTAYRRADSITTNIPAITIKRGLTVRPAFFLNPAESYEEISYQSSDEAVASVGEDGTIRAAGTGTAVITATTTSGLTCEVRVTVPSSCKTTTKIKLSSTSKTISRGKYFTLKATCYGSSTGKLFYSSNTRIATVSSKGVVRGVQRGTCYIYCRTASGKIKYCKVKVKVPATSVSIPESSIYLVKGISSTYYIKPTLAPFDTTDSVSYKSSNKRIAKVSSSGKVTALKKGTCYITVKASSGKYKKLKVSVKQPTSYLKLSKTTANIYKGSSLTISSYVSSGANKVVRWSSSDESVARVSSTGKVTAVSNGTAIITAFEVYSGRTATCTVNVRQKATALRLEYSTSVLVPGTAVGSVTVNAIMTPAGCNDSLTFTSSKPSVALVSSSGVVTAKAPGTATITVKTGSGITKSFKVTVR